jgi:hypothetical protein
MQPRRVLLLAILAALVLYNLWRWNHNRTAYPRPQSTTAASDPAGAAAALWGDFDTTATLIDAPDSQYNAAVQKLQTDMAAVADPNLKPNADTLADIRNCQIWLQFYRQHPTGDWHQRSLAHIQSCTKNHADIAH